MLSPRILACALLAGALAPSLGFAAPLPEYRHGIYMMSPLPASDREFDQLSRALNGTPALQGVFIHAGWAELEPESGKSDFSRLDRTIALVRAAGKKYALGCLGSDVPAFIFTAGAKKFSYRDDNPHHGPRYGTLQAMALPWDPIWQAGYERIQRQLGERYAGDPRCLAVDLAASRTFEMHFPRQPEDLANWAKYGDYRAKVAATYEKFLDVLAEAFPRQQLTLMVSQMFNASESADSPDRRTIESIIDYGLKRYPDRLTLQTNQLAGRRDQSGTFSYGIVQEYAGRVHHGFQSVASLRTTPERQGSMEMSTFNYLQGSGEYWEVWRGDGLDGRTVTALDRTIASAQSAGLAAYGQALKKSGKFRTADQDTYRPPAPAKNGPADPASAPATP